MSMPRDRPDLPKTFPFREGEKANPVWGVAFYSVVQRVYVATGKEGKKLGN
jgi:hypothetical protein